ncbi:MAG TPA: SDR family oxidoreductase [Fimbriimonadaceae bacterium]|jgi:L-fucose dehydrogenase
MDLQLQGKNVIVTGGAKGIGEGVARVLAAEGAIPFIVGHNEADNLKTVKSIEANGGRANQVAAELTDPEECRRAVETVLAQVGQIDHLVNNVGVNDGVSLATGTYEAFVKSLHKTLIHYFLFAHYALPSLKQNKGAIVNIGSKTGETGQGGTSGYAASNGGKNGLTREWAVELAPFGIRVNAVIVAECFTPQYETWIQTIPDPEATLAKINSRIPLGGRMTTATEIANMVCFLLSPVSSHTTGQLIHVDGGYVHLDRAMLSQ